MRKIVMVYGPEMAPTMCVLVPNFHGPPPSRPSRVDASLLGGKYSIAIHTASANVLSLYAPPRLEDQGDRLTRGVVDVDLQERAKEA